MDANDALRAALVKAGSQANLSSVLAVSQSTVSLWVSEKRNPSAGAYRKLLKYLGIPLPEVRRLVDQRVAAAGEQ